MFVRCFCCQTQIDATSSNPSSPHDEDGAKVLQAIKQMAGLTLEGTSGIDQRLKFLKVFISLSPPQYAGNPDEPLEGVEWLERIKQCFDLSDVPENLKVGFATYCLIGAAQYWWEFVKRTRDVKSVTWAEFEELFLNMYFPETIRDAKRDEFLGLTQRNMTVAQYESKFLQLSRYAPHLVSTDELACFLSRISASFPFLSLLKGLKLACFRKVLSESHPNNGRHEWLQLQVNNVCVIVC